MSDKVLIILIVVIAVAVVIILFLLRKQIKRFFFKFGNEGLETQIETHSPAARKNKGESTHKPGHIKISRNVQVGEEHKIDVGLRDVNVEDNIQSGKKHEITAQSEKELRKKP